MNPFKNVDLVAKAFQQLEHHRLIIVGDGPDFKRIERLASSNVKLVGRVSDDELVHYMQRARAFVYAAPEDFGMVMAEAQACGTPVIALGVGGALEIVNDHSCESATGVLYSEPTVASLCQAINKFETAETRITPSQCRSNALRFDSEIFRLKITETVRAAWKDWEATCY